jgi:hypothetical protein
MPTPAVGADIESLCGKCGDVWHVVAAKLGDSVIKVVCKQCGQQHRYKPVPGSPAAIAAEARKAKRAAKTGATGAAKKTKSARGEAAATPSVAADPSKPVRPYRPADTYAPGERVEHPSFGTGVVESSPGPGKIQVFFSEGRRVLACAKAESTLAAPTARRADTEGGGGKPPPGVG